MTWFRVSVLFLQYLHVSSPGRPLLDTSLVGKRPDLNLHRLINWDPVMQAMWPLTHSCPLVLLTICFRGRPSVVSNHLALVSFCNSAAKFTSGCSPLNGIIPLHLLISLAIWSELQSSTNTSSSDLASFVILPSTSLWRYWGIT